MIVNTLVLAFAAAASVATAPTGFNVNARKLQRIAPVLNYTFPQTPSARARLTNFGGPVVIYIYIYIYI